jgi:hypothetical protein
MTRTELLEARVKANLLLRVRDELDAADKLPEHSRQQRRQEILACARREYGPTFDDDGVLDALDAADEWHEPIASETNTLKQLAFQANQRIRGAA